MEMGISGTPGVLKAAGLIAGSAAPLLAAVEVQTRQFGHLLNTRVKGRASGRPGPNTITGDYRRSIATQFRRVGSRFIAEVGTNKPQGRRLEFGFHDTDSLGRTYNDPPYPHFGPALDETEPQFRAAVRALIA